MRGSKINYSNNKALKMLEIMASDLSNNVVKPAAKVTAHSFIGQLPYKQRKYLLNINNKKLDKEDLKELDDVSVKTSYVANAISSGLAGILCTEGEIYERLSVGCAFFIISTLESVVREIPKYENNRKMALGSVLGIGLSIPTYLGIQIKEYLSYVKLRAEE